MITISRRTTSTRRRSRLDLHIDWRMTQTDQPSSQHQDRQSTTAHHIDQVTPYLYATLKISNKHHTYASTPQRPTNRRRKGRKGRMGRLDTKRRRMEDQMINSQRWSTVTNIQDSRGEGLSILHKTIHKQGEQGAQR